MPQRYEETSTKPQKSVYCFAVCSTFHIFGNNSAKFFDLKVQSVAQILRLGKKKETVSLFYARLFVSLQEFAGFLYIKAIWGIEDFEGYELETVLNSTFCYKLLSMSTRR
jgi:hypothetical protein